MCCCCCGNKTEDISIPFNGEGGLDHETIAENFADLLTITIDEKKTILYAEGVPMDQAKSAWIAFCSACLAHENLKFTTVHDRESWEEFWYTINGVKIHAEHRHEEAEILRAKAADWMQLKKVKRWELIDGMNHKYDLSSRQKAYLMVRLADAECFSLLKNNMMNTDIFTLGVQKAQKHAANIVNENDSKTLGEMAAKSKSDSLFWEEALAVTIALGE